MDFYHEFFGHTGIFARNANKTRDPCLAPFWYQAICQLHFLQDAAGDRAAKIFRELDVNGDGELDEGEFVKGCLEDGELMSLLNSGGLSAINNDSDSAT